MKHIRKKALAVLLTVILAVGVSPATGLIGLLAAAEPVGGICGAEGDNLIWSLDTDTGALTISGTGDMADFDDEDNAAPWAEYNDVIRSVTISSGVTSIGDYAFYSYPLLTSAIIGEDVTRIGEAAFALSSLESVDIPASVEEIDELAFVCLCLSDDDGFAPTIQSINVNSANAAFSSEDGVLYNKAKTTLIQYPVGKTSSTFDIPNGVTTVGERAFILSVLLKSVTIPDSVTEIGECVFEECSGLEIVTIGSGVETISVGSFLYCVSLSTVTIPDNVITIEDDAFYECESMATLTLGSGVETIGKNAFQECSSLTSVTIPNSVKTIGAYAFMDCSALANVTLGSGLETIDRSAFFACTSLESIHIPSNVTTIGNDAFANCDRLAFICSDDANGAAKTYAAANGIEFRYCGSEQPTNTVSGVCGAKGDDVVWTLDLDTGALTISGTGAMADYGSKENIVPWAAYRDSIQALTVENGVSGVGNYAFAECVNLTSVTLGDNVTSIGNNAFNFCMGLTSVTLPEGLTTIGDMAFAYTGLTSVSIPSAVQEIGMLAFIGVTESPEGDPVPALERIDVDPSNTVFASEDGVLYNKAKTTLIQYPCADSRTEFDIPGSVTTIGIGAFVFSSNQQTITIPDSVTAIEEAAFEYCSSLQSITIPNGITEIADSAFSDCRSLASVTIPDSVTAIGDYAFDGCAALADVTFGNNVYTIGKSAFKGCTNLTAVILPGSVTAIGDSAFEQCSKLESIHIPVSVKTIGNNALRNCSNLAYICCSNMDSYAKTYADKNNIEFRLCSDHGGNSNIVCGECGDNGDNVLWTLHLDIHEMVISGAGAMADYAVADNTPWSNYRSMIQSVTIQSGVTTIGINAFCDCTYLTNVTIGEDVTVIGNNAFNHAALVNIAIPRSVQQIGLGAFDCYTNFGNFVSTLQAFTVDAENAVFSSADGILYNKMQTALVKYPNGAARVTFEIPDIVTRIETEAFKFAVNLTSVHIPASVTEIGSAAFSGCNSLEYLCCDYSACYAKTYAQANGIQFNLCVGHDGATRIAGDANGDGVVNLKDAVLIRRYLAGGWDDVAIYAANANVDTDDSVTLQDVTLICRYLAGGWDVVLI